MSSENNDALAFEAATNRRYLSSLREKAASIGRPAVSISDNERWLEHFPHAGAVAVGPLVARIGLTEDDEDLGSAFYIGARWLSDFDHPVVSWDAPVAKIFFEPDDKTHELADRVLVRRTLLERLNEIVKVYDSWEAGVTPNQSPFSSKLRVPSAPRSSQGRISVRAPLPSSANASASSSDATTRLDRNGQTPRSTSIVPRSSADARERLLEGMRSVEAVDYALQAPRNDALTSVLSTLQPDQYRLVTHRGDEPLIVQGHPGTGKTIIAIHRAAYLVGKERPESVKRLLFLGPTDEWVRHVSALVRGLDVDDRVSVRALPAWLDEISGLKRRIISETDGSAEDVGKFVKDVLDRAAGICSKEHPWATGAGARIKNLERLYNVVRDGGTDSNRLPLGNVSSGWIKTLPAFREAITYRRYLPLFAQASISILGVTQDSYGHIVVDEAQDLSGLEWEIVRAHNAEGGWTLVGDMNQRMTDFGDPSWDRLIKRLDLRSTSGSLEPRVIERGYRSTQPILDFAKPLLPRLERCGRSLQQDGPAPKVTRATKAAERDHLAISEAKRLQRTYPDGTVAVIAAHTDASSLEQTLLSSGWRRGRQPGDWQKDDRRLALRTPESVRGVEFDAVVVVEPGAFPRNLARVGPLYTSLTRANRELAVVHHAALPDQLRRHGRR